MKIPKQIAHFSIEIIYSSLRNNESYLAERMRRILFRTNCHIDTAVVITNKHNFGCGVGCALYHGTYILNNNGTLILGENSHLGAMCYVNACHGNVKIGNDVAIGPHTTIISYSNHYEVGKKVTEVRIVKDVVIGNNVFVGSNCTILPGSIIGENVVVGAGSVVKGCLEGNAIYAGAPCNKIRDLVGKNS